MANIQKLRKKLQPKIDQLSLVPIGELDPEQSESLRKTRNLPEIRSNMYSAHEISKEEHQSWLKEQGGSDRNFYFAVLEDKEIIGGLSIVGHDKQNKRAEWAFYLTPSRQKTGEGVALEFIALDYAFYDLGLDKLDCEVLEFNDTVISLHKKFGFEVEGIRRARVNRDGKSVNAVLLGITRNDWIAANGEEHGKR